MSTRLSATLQAPLSMTALQQQDISIMSSSDQRECPSEGGNISVQGGINVGFGALTTAFVMNLSSICERLNVRVTDLLEVLRKKNSNEFSVHIRMKSNANPKSPSFGKQKAILTLSVAGDQITPFGYGTHENSSSHPNISVLKGVCVPITKCSNVETTLDQIALYNQPDDLLIFTSRQPEVEGTCTSCEISKTADLSEASWLGTINKNRTIFETATRVRCEMNTNENVRCGSESFRTGSHSAPGSMPLSQRMGLDSSLMYDTLADGIQETDNSPRRNDDEASRHIKRAYVVCEPSLPYSLLVVPPTPRSTKSSFKKDPRSRFDLNQVRDVTILEEDDVVTVLVEFDRPPLLWLVVLLCSSCYGIFWATICILATQNPPSDASIEAKKNWIDNKIIFVQIIRSSVAAFIIHIVVLVCVELPLLRQRTPLNKQSPATRRRVRYYCSLCVAFSTMGKAIFLFCLDQLSLGGVASAMTLFACFCPLYVLVVRFLRGLRMMLWECAGLFLSTVMTVVFLVWAPTTSILPLYCEILIALSSIGIVGQTYMLYKLRPFVSTTFVLLVDHLVNAIGSIAVFAITHPSDIHIIVSLEQPSYVALACLSYIVATAAFIYIAPFLNVVSMSAILALGGPLSIALLMIWPLENFPFNSNLSLAFVLSASLGLSVLLWVSAYGRRHVTVLVKTVEKLK